MAEGVGSNHGGDAAAGGPMRSAAAAAASTHRVLPRRKLIYALDFDGVLVDSAAETAYSGLAAAQKLWPGADWLAKNRPRDQMQALVHRFAAIRSRPLLDHHPLPSPPAPPRNTRAATGQPLHEAIILLPRCCTVGT